MRPLRILLADDHDLIRRGLRMLLESHPDWTICAEACTGQEAVVKSEELKPDIAILDITMPDVSGIEAAGRILKASPNTEILIFSAHSSDRLIQEILDAGIRGYISKSDSDHDLIRAVEILANHKPFIGSRATDLVLGRLDRKGQASKIPAHLTSREHEVVQMLSEGKTNKEAASILGISAKTIETHRANVMRKLGLHTAGQLVRYAVRNQIIEP
jgi:two-component system, NarL family, response regulator NreC